MCLLLQCPEIAILDLRTLLVTPIEYSLNDSEGAYVPFLEPIVLAD
jgi:hypothetical protein